MQKGALRGTRNATSTFGATVRPRATVMEVQRKAAFFLAQAADRGEDEGLSLVTVAILVSLAILLVIIIWAVRRAMRRCIFCRHMCESLPDVCHEETEGVLLSLDEYEGVEVRPGNVMLCVNCRTAYNCTPRSHVTLGSVRLKKEDAVATGVRLQIDHFACHRCGGLLEDADSPCLDGADRKRVKRAVRHAGATAGPGMPLFCCECKIVHLWAPLADTGYKYLRVAAMPDKDIDPS